MYVSYFLAGFKHTNLFFWYVEMFPFKKRTSIHLVKKKTHFNIREVLSSVELARANTYSQHNQAS